MWLSASAAGLSVDRGRSPRSHHRSQWCASQGSAGLVRNKWGRVIVSGDYERLTNYEYRSVRFYCNDFSYGNAGALRRAKYQ